MSFSILVLGFYEHSIELAFWSIFKYRLLHILVGQEAEKVANLFAAAQAKREICVLSVV